MAVLLIFAHLFLALVRDIFLRFMCSEMSDFDRCSEKERNDAEKRKGRVEGQRERKSGRDGGEGERKEGQTGGSKEEERKGQRERRIVGEKRRERERADVCLNLVQAICYLSK